jgi:hypothetical protein
MISAMSILVISNGCIYRTRKFNTVNDIPCFERWHIEPNAIAYQGSSGKSVSKNNFYHCNVCLYKNLYKKLDSTSNYFARIDYAVINCNGNKIERDNSDTSFNQRRCFEIPEWKGARASEIFIPKEIDTISFIVHCTFKNKKTAEEVQKEYDLKLKRYESWFILFPLY